MTDYRTTLRILDRALNAQRFRRVTLNSVVGPAISLPISVGTDVDAALATIDRDPNWIEVARQLNQLQTKNFVDLYIRRDSHDLELAPIFAWAGDVSLAYLKPTIEWTWTITLQLRSLLGSFKLSDGNLGVLSKAITKLANAGSGNSAPPPTKSASGIPSGEDAGNVGTKLSENQSPIGSSPYEADLKLAATILEAIVDLSWAQTPVVSLIAITTSAFAPDVLAAAGTWGELRREYKVPTWSIEKPALNTVLLSSPTLAVYGHTQLNSLNFDELRASLLFLANSG